MFDVELQEDSFVIDNDTKAEWALKKIMEAQTERDRLQKVCAEQIAYYSSLHEQYEQSFVYEKMRMERMLEGYFRQVPHKSAKTQESYKLPSGTLEYKYEKYSLEHNAPVLLSFLKENNMSDYINIKVEEAPKWGELKKQLMNDGSRVTTKDGQVVDGVTACYVPASFKVVVKA